MKHPPSAPAGAACPCPYGALSIAASLLPWLLSAMIVSTGRWLSAKDLEMGLMLVLIVCGVLLLLAWWAVIPWGILLALLGWRRDRVKWPALVGLAYNLWMAFILLFTYLR